MSRLAEDLRSILEGYRAQLRDTFSHSWPIGVWLPMLGCFVAKVGSGAAAESYIHEGIFILCVHRQGAS